MRRLEEIVAHVEATSAPADLMVGGVAYDSRAVKAGDLFVALPGEKVDGHDFIPQAVAAGAAAVMLERVPPGLDVPYVKTTSCRSALALVARQFYGDPTAEMKLIGVTGTNGKTTTTYLIRAILNAHFGSSALIGTLGAWVGDETLPLNHTTPEAPDILSIFARARDNGVKAGVMEVSSHGIAMERVQGCRYDVGVFTNLTQDHLDFHGTMESYAATKERLFTELAEAGGKPFVGVMNIDDEYGRRYARALKGRLLKYGVSTDADVRASDIRLTVGEVRYRLDTPFGSTEFHAPLGAKFNVWNTLAAVAAGLSVGAPLDQVVQTLAGATGVPGRFEAVPTGRDFAVIVDYAHTPDALEKLLQTARELGPKRLVTVFGCGGNRDRTKRPKMGGIATELADRAFVTSDNPRKEDPQAIIADILEGISPERKASAVVEPDRKAAIHAALESAQPGDLIVIAGKGHEDYQIIGETKYPFDDRKVVREYLGVSS